MYSGEYDACDVTLSVYSHRASLKNMPGHGGNRTYDLWNTIPKEKNFEVENFQLLTMIFSEHFLSVENFLEWKWAR